MTDSVEIRLMGATDPIDVTVGDISAGAFMDIQSELEKTGDNNAYLFSLIALTLWHNGEPVFQSGKDAAARLRLQDMAQVSDLVLDSLGLDDASLEAQGKP